MKTKITQQVEVDLTHLRLKCQVRYWEDATVSGAEDIDGTLIPFRVGDLWCPVIEIDTGQIVDWPQGTVAHVHYKVCDAGVYELCAGEEVLLTEDGYVPEILNVSKESYGDYVVLEIDENGKIKHWPDEHDISDFQDQDHE